MKAERIVLIAALAAGMSYLLANNLGVAGAALIAWKGAGVALLAIWCAIHARCRDGWLIAAVMAFGAAGDVLVEAAGLTAGAAAFLIGHIVAIWLYRRNSRETHTASQKLLAAAVAIGTPLIAWSITLSVEVALYAAALGIMAATAWLSRFPRYRTGIGAMLFVASDLLIFREMGVVNGPSLRAQLVWPLYFSGQVLIAYGVIRTLQRESVATTS